MVSKSKIKIPRMTFISIEAIFMVNKKRCAAEISFDESNKNSWISWRDDNKYCRINPIL